MCNKKWMTAPPQTSAGGCPSDARKSGNNITEILPHCTGKDWRRKTYDGLSVGRSHRYQGIRIHVSLPAVPSPIWRCRGATEKRSLLKSTIQPSIMFFGTVEGYRVTVGCDPSGQINAEELRAVLEQKPVLVSIMLVNNENHHYKISPNQSFMSRSVQAFGKLAFQVKGLKADLYP